MIYIWTTLILAFTAHASIGFDVTLVGSGDEAAGPIQLEIQASTNLTLDVSTSGTATAGIDYVPVSATLSVISNQPFQQQISIIDDDENEEPETLIIDLADRATGDVTTVEVIIQDDDPVTITASDSVFEEGTLAMINLTCAFPSGSSSLTFSVVPSDGTAVAGVDYTFSATQYTCTFGASIVSVIIPLTDDTERTSDKTFSLSVDTGFSVAGDVVVPVTILENDPLCNPPCQHGGVCAVSGCMCPDGYTGSHCESKVPISRQGNNKYDAAGFVSGRLSIHWTMQYTTENNVGFHMTGTLCSLPPFIKIK